MKQLLLLRHAKSSWETPNLDDHDRPLNKRGRKAAEDIAKWIIENDLIPDQILVSSAQRTQETCQIILDNWDANRIDIPQHRNTIAQLYHAPPDVILSTISQATAPQTRRLMLIGHNPGLELLVSLLANQDITFPTAALAVFDAQSNFEWEDTNLEPKLFSQRLQLSHLVRPREL